MIGYVGFSEKTIRGNKNPVDRKITGYFFL